MGEVSFISKLRNFLNQAYSSEKSRYSSSNVAMTERADEDFMGEALESRVLLAADLTAAACKRCSLCRTRVLLSFLVHVQNTDSYAGWQGASTVRRLTQFPTPGGHTLARPPQLPARIVARHSVELK